MGAVKCIRECLPQSLKVACPCRSRGAPSKMSAHKPFVPALDAANVDPDAGTAYSFPRDLKGYGRHPPDPQWPGGAKIAVSFVINYEEVSSPCHVCQDQH